MRAACRTQPPSNGQSWLLSFLLLVLAAPAYSQSLGEVARQERERRRNQPRRATRVYTNEDLARPQILRPEDRERFQAAQKKAAPAASEPAAEAASSKPEIDALSLGDIARRNRALQQARQKREGPWRVPQQPEMGAPVLAHPTSSPSPVRIAAPPGRPSFARPERGRAGKARIREEPFGGMRVRVQPGDTLWRLAREYLGHGTDWLLLAAINPQLTDPTKLRVGGWVRLPDKVPALQPLKRVRVERGDSLWKLAQARFGSGSTWSCIAQANPQLQDPNLIFPGEMLTIPASCEATP